MPDLKKDLIHWLDKMEGVDDKAWFSQIRNLIKYIPPGDEGKIWVCLFIGKLAENEPNIANSAQYPGNEERLANLAKQYGLIPIAKSIAKNPNLVRDLETKNTISPHRKR